MRIALAQYDFPVGDITGNVRRIQTLIEQARDAHGADLIVFPELCVSGYSPEDLLFRPQFLAECDTAVRAIAHSTQGIVAVVGWPEAAGSVVSLEEILARFCKILRLTCRKSRVNIQRPAGRLM